MKAKLFINYALDDAPERTFDERALWASVAGEIAGSNAPPTGIRFHRTRVAASE